MHANQNDDLSAEIRSHLNRVLVASSGVEPILMALAQLDFADAAALLTMNERSVRKTCSSDVLRKILDAILTACLSIKNGGASKGLIRLAYLYCDIISPDMAAALARSLLPEDRDDDVRELIRTILKRVPRHSGLLRVASEIVLDAGEAEAAHRLLTQLAGADESPATINYVYRTRAKLTPPKGVKVRAAFLSSFTIETLLPYVDLEIRKLGLLPEVYVAPFNSWAQEIVDEDSKLRRFNPEIAFLSVAIDDLVPELAGNPSISLLDKKGRDVVDHVVGVVERFMAWSSSTLIVHNFHSSYRSPMGVLESRTGQTRFGWLNELNMYFTERLHTLGRVFVVDMNELLMYRPGGNLDNPKMRYLARMRLGEQTLHEVAYAYARYVAPLKGLRRKCIVLDLDNTLWGGIVGEAGPHGVNLGDTSPGIEYQDFQRYLLSLTERGFLLAINSKNNPEDAFTVIRSHESMVLREDSFSTVRINWRPKTENMASIAEELNIGLDSMIFLDDNPNERELMRQVFPEVLTPDLPQDPSLYRSTIERLPQLQSLVVTEEDQIRVKQYRTKRQREEVRAKTQSLDEYLQALEIFVQLSRANDETLPRLHQLFERTNQFNLTTRRYTHSQLAAFAHDGGWRLYALRAQDRFGDHGLVAAALVHTEPGCWTLDSFVMSCRVIGYGVETALLAVVTEGARDAGVTTVIGEYVPTAKNAPARDFYSRHGFKEEGAKEGVTRWTMCLNESRIARPEWIKMEITDAT